MVNTCYCQKFADGSFAREPIIHEEFNSFLKALPMKAAKHGLLKNWIETCNGSKCRWMNENGWN